MPSQVVVRHAEKRPRDPAGADQRQVRRRTVARDLTTEQLDARSQKVREAKAMIGLRVRFHSRVLRQKPAAPAGVLEIREVSPRDDRLGFTLVGKDARGKSIKYKDSFNMSEDLESRYKRTNEEDAAPFDPEQYQNFFRSSLKAGERAKKEVDLPSENLYEIMPFFQSEEALAGKTIRRNGNGSKADLSYLLALDSVPFHGTDGDSARRNIWRATTGEGTHYDNPDKALRKRVCNLLHIRYTRDDIMNGRCPVPPELRSVGGTNIHPWQAQLYTEFQMMMRDRTGGNTILMSRQRGGYGCVQGITSRPEALTVYVAQPGEGKTRVACLCAFDRPTLVVAPGGTIKHWKKEANMVGVPAFQVGSGGKTVAEASKLVEANASQMWLMTRKSVQRLATKGSLSLLPVPQLVVVDEFHLPFTCLKQIYAQWPGVVVLGLSGTFHRDNVISAARDMGWDEDVLEAAVVRVPLEAKRGVFPNVEVEVKEVTMSRLEAAFYSTGQTWMTDQQRQRHLVFSPPESRGGAEDYNRDLWSGIVAQLQAADDEIHIRLARLLKHIFSPERKQACLESIAKEPSLGEEAAEKIRALSEDLADVVTSYGPSEVRTHLTEAMERRLQVVGCYRYLTKQLDEVAATSEIFCPVCMETTRDWSIATCGHLACVECSHVPALQASCPTCRAARPTWINALEMARLRAPLRAVGGGDLDVTVELDTSGKLKGLASILLSLPSSERALVVCPEKQLIRNVAAEMTRVGVRLGIMTGSDANMETTLSAWRAGRKAYKGLLCLPSIHGVDLPEATTIVFLTTTISPDDYEQALARVVRQGNESVEKGVAVKVWFIVYRGTEEEDPNNLEVKKKMTKKWCGERQNPASSSTDR